MRFVIPAVLIAVALIHILPLAGVISASRLGQLYGVAISDPNLEILLRHRAVLFGLLAAFLACAAFRPALHGLALGAAWASVLSFLLLAYSVGGYNSALSTVIKVDWLAVGLLSVATVVLVIRWGSVKG